MTTPAITYEVCIDWDATNWSATPDFSESYDTVAGTAGADGVNLVSIQRGKQKEEGNAPAATCEIRMRPSFHAKYSPYNADSNLEGKIRPYLPVRVRSYYNSEYKTIFTGFISAIRVHPHADIQSVVFYCTDGMDLLARQLITQDPTDTTEMSDGEAIGKILDAAGWSSSKRDIDTSGGSNLLNYPACTQY